VREESAESCYSLFVIFFSSSLAVSFRWLPLEAGLFFFVFDVARLISGEGAKTCCMLLSFLPAGSHDFTAIILPKVRFPTLRDIPGVTHASDMPDFSLTFPSLRPFNLALFGSPNVRSHIVMSFSSGGPLTSIIGLFSQSGPCSGRTNSSFFSREKFAGLCPL